MTKIMLPCSPEGARIKVKTMITRRVAAGVVFTPFHFGGWFDCKDLVDKYPAGAAPYVRGEACNTAFTYGYDSVTPMQEQGEFVSGEGGVRVGEK